MRLTEEKIYRIAERLHDERHERRAATEAADLLMVLLSLEYLAVRCCTEDSLGPVLVRLCQWTHNSNVSKHCEAIK